MSELRVDSVKSKGGGAPDLPKGVTISGITTAVTLGATQIDVSNVNVSGVVTSGTLSGSLLSTGTPTLGLGVTINSSGVAISGVATAGIVSATTLYGDGTNITGLGATLAPLFYQPDPYDTGVLFSAGIGITFNQQIKAGTGNITIRKTNASGTVVENFGVGSSVTISENKVTFTPTSDLEEEQLYHLSYPSGCFTNNEGTAYVGTAYTFQSKAVPRELWMWGENENGVLAAGLAHDAHRSSPVQIPSTKWKSYTAGLKHSVGTKSDGTLYSWGENENGRLGLNGETDRSSPTQVPGTTWSTVSAGRDQTLITKTDGTLWVFGDNTNGVLGVNSLVQYSSPVQVPGTTWATSGAKKLGVNPGAVHAIKSDGTYWVWGFNNNGVLGLSLSESSRYSSPVQLPGTTWDKLTFKTFAALATKTDGTLWSWGYNGTMGLLGQNTIGGGGTRSSPIQIPGTTWSSVSNTYFAMAALKSDGTLWAWGDNTYGTLGQNNRTTYRSPVQIPGTTWRTIDGGLTRSFYATKTDGSLWAWGSTNAKGQLGQNNVVSYSSPVQIPGTWSSDSIGIDGGDKWCGAIKET